MFESKKDRIERLEQQVEGLQYGLAEARASVRSVITEYDNRIIALELASKARTPITNDERAELEELREFKRRVLLAAVQGEEP